MPCAFNKTNTGFTHLKRQDYSYSTNATPNGQMRLIVDFDIKTDPNTDLIPAQMRQNLASSQLPTSVTNHGVTVQRTSIAPLMLVSLYSQHGTYDAKFLVNYAYINLNDQLTRVPGIGSVQVFGAGQYAMRLWVKPDQLTKLGITVPEIVSAIQAKKTLNPAGQIGSEPAPRGQEYIHSVRAQGPLVSPEAFGDIVIREALNGGVVRVSDVARVELGAQDSSLAGRLDGKPGAIIALYQLPGSNAVQAADGVKRLMAEVKNFSTGSGLCGFARYNARRERGHQTHHPDAAHRDLAVDCCGLPVSIGGAGGAGSVDGGPGGRASRQATNARTTEKLKCGTGGRFY